MSTLEQLAAHVAQLAQKTAGTYEELTQAGHRVAAIQTELSAAARAGIDVRGVQASLASSENAIRSGAAAAAQAAQLAASFAKSLVGGGQGGLGTAGPSPSSDLTGTQIPSGREYLTDDDPELKWCAANMVAPEGYHCMVMHGNANSVFAGDTELDADGLAALARSDPSWGNQPILLHACNAGAGDESIAQQLADRLGVEVRAPADYGYFDNDPPEPTSWQCADTPVGPLRVKQTDFRSFYPRSTS